MSVSPEPVFADERNLLWEYATQGSSGAVSDVDSVVLREAMCLHGQGPVRHTSTVSTAFDVEDELVWDAIGSDIGSAVS
jgi:hypothetical protein